MQQRTIDTMTKTNPQVLHFSSLMKHKTHTSLCTYCLFRMKRHSVKLGPLVYPILRPCNWFPCYGALKIVDVVIITIISNK